MCTETVGPMLNIIWVSQHQQHRSDCIYNVPWDRSNNSEQISKRCSHAGDMETDLGGLGGGGDGAAAAVPAASGAVAAGAQRK
jgi:nanoRNase/pAp phosphatase (c-di-AMP/oligoRNAs hydrolase)